MSEETIKLRVPDDVPEDFPESVEQGNLATKLPVGGEIEIKNRKFADWLIREHGLAEVKPETGQKKTGGKK